MPGNSEFRFRNVGVLAVASIDAPVVVTSAEIDAQLSKTYQRVGLRPGLLQRLAGIQTRRWWAEGTTFADGAAMAGGKAIAESGVSVDDIGLLLNTSVSRAHLEPATAASVHDAIGLPSSCQSLDITNACLGFLNGMQLAAAMIDSGQIEYALIVNGEDARPAHQAALRRLGGQVSTSKDVIAEFATLTLGSGAVAMLLGPADRNPHAHRLVGGATRSSTSHHQLCVGDVELMRTDSKNLLKHGLELCTGLWRDAQPEFGWASGADRYVIHQISQVHTDAISAALGIDPALVPTTFPTHGNIGPASVPFTLAAEMDSLTRGAKVLLMGVGSGLNACCLELEW
ncbi:MAG TPA: 3-oxoacyl-ACP synthase III [Jatrophihabitans sp.]|jgi:3-oxoacyl-[acyl-carrier-protein] synthase-3|uniref:3-oxoacyl-ACP synthase III n=1 Tax=Jatrophihabitans sp. TaxID=1932789 RepID=UPI002EE5269B